ncbi:MAG: serine/threonine protein kinase, partial [Pirellulaceae bacterium]
MTAKLLNSNEPIPGYVLVSRIGAGGYGEVWQVDAPGGLTKAIKFVYGRVDETRATSELKALERVKQVRHPFLLSLERFEIVDNQLLIVMELADASIHARFEECVDEGLHGIPRAELLSYLHDAADALDYMRERHGLQHLDVKPENLLLLAGHIKVADFGLVQGFQSQQMSLLGGLTPQYAPPEVFQGQPTGFSDQYSLAVLFTELLTGHLPFDGVNAAQLTNQHLNEEPNLQRLADGDRQIIGRALAKNPDDRFPSCTEMIDALINSSRRRADDTQEESEDNCNNNWMKSKATAVSGRTSHKTAVIDTTGLPKQAAREQEFMALQDVP